MFGADAQSKKLEAPVSSTFLLRAPWTLCVDDFWATCSLGATSHSVILSLPNVETLYLIQFLMP